MTIKRIPKRPNIDKWIDKDGRIDPWAWCNDWAPFDTRVDLLVQALKRAGQKGLAKWDDIHPLTLGEAAFHRGLDALFEITIRPRAMLIDDRVYLRRCAPDSGWSASNSLADRVRAAATINDAAALRAELAAIAEALDAAAARRDEASKAAADRLYGRTAKQGT